MKKKSCIHLDVADLDEGKVDYYLYFSDNNINYSLICFDCFNTDDSGKLDIELIGNNTLDCYFDLNDQGMYFEGIRGVVTIKENNNNEISIKDNKLQIDFSGFKLIKYTTNRMNIYSVLTRNNDIKIQMNCIHSGEKILDFNLSGSDNIDYNNRIGMKLSNRNEMLVIYNIFGIHGAVYDLRTETLIFTFEREDYHLRHCIFPVVFTERDGKTVLIHGSEYNRLEITDPITKTTYPQIEENDLRDYFFSDLIISPGNRLILSNGWVWSPVGQIRYWDLERWLIDLSGSDVACDSLNNTNYYWNRSICWVDSIRIAVYGFGSDEENVIPAVLIYNLEDGYIENWFAVTEGQLVFDEYLYVMGNKSSFSIYNLNGERIFHDRDRILDEYLTENKFISYQSNGVFLISEINF